MKYIVILLLIAFVSNAQITKNKIKPYALAQNITLTSGTFTITKQFKVNIKGNRMPDYLKG
jgi:hexosaminidase